MTPSEVGIGCTSSTKVGSVDMKLSIIMDLLSMMDNELKTTCGPYVLVWEAQIFDVLNEQYSRDN